MGGGARRREVCITPFVAISPNPNPNPPTLGPVAPTSPGIPGGPVEPCADAGECCHQMGARGTCDLTGGPVLPSSPVSPRSPVSP